MPGMLNTPAMCPVAHRQRLDGRRIEMETRLSQLHTPDAKEREIRKYSKIESQHLRLRRTKIKLTDFRTVKVIGKGAFGEASFPIRVCDASRRLPLTIASLALLGAISTEGGYGESVCDEESTKGRNVEERPGMDLFLALIHCQSARSSPANTSWLMFVQSATSLQSLRLHGLCSCSTHFKTLCTCTSSWSFCQVET